MTTRHATVRDVPRDHHEGSHTGVDGQVEVTVIIVTYNSAATIGPCLTAVAGSCGPEREVIVVDNDSSDGTVVTIARTHPEVVVIPSGSNLGFSRACNLGARTASGRRLLFLNPDTVVDAHALAIAGRALDVDPTIGAVGARTLYGDGTVNRTCCFGQPSLVGTALRAVGISTLFHHSTLLNPEEIGGWDRSTTRDVGVITGCFLMLDREFFGELGGFDERFFMYSEDTDLSLRIRDAGRRCVHLSDATVVHHGGGSDNVPARKMVKVLTARAQFFRKHWSRPTAYVGVRLLDLTVLLRALAWRIRGRASKWAEVWKARAEWRQCRPL